MIWWLVGGFVSGALSFGAFGVFVGWQVGLTRGFGDGFDAAVRRDKAP